MNISTQSDRSVRKVVFIILLILCLTPIVDPPIALFLGFICAQTIGHPFLHLNHTATNWLLKTAVVGLGFSMNLRHALEAGKTGLLVTVFSISLTLFAGWLLANWLKIDRKTSYLISCGTAICGGSAIAAIAPIVKADKQQVSVALGTVFVLNSLALLLFPTIGHWLHLSQTQFGFWSAIAIHDTSSVVGAASKYGQEALQIATTIKLERALWIIPISIGTAFMDKGNSQKIRIPYFIGLYVLAMGICTYFPGFEFAYSAISQASRKGLTMTLFLIGSGLSIGSLKAVGIKPLFQGFALWLVISVVSATIVMTMIH
jgi:uncharacterized integral membrane protein (TIGR00698 family)